MSLTFVPTPLGNLRDITQRALDALRGCDLIVAEDTRVARRLLSAFGISGKRLWSYREQNAAGASAPILERAALERVVLVSDAGMPGICDPGRELLVAARAAGIPVEVLPGPVAFVTAAVLSGFELAGLTFEGFLPRTAGARNAALQAALARSGPTAWYESPNRIVATLAALETLEPAVRVFLARELTKLHEQQSLGTPAEVAAGLERPVRGEIALILEPPSGSRSEEAGERDIDAEIDALLARGLPPSTIAKQLAAAGPPSRAELYRRVVARAKPEP